MFDFLKRKNKQHTDIDTATYDDSDMSDLNKPYGSAPYDDMIDEAVRKNIYDSDQFVNPRANDEGNYFGQEFNIDATVGRIKALHAREPWVFATATLLAKALSTIEYKVYDSGNDEVLDSHPLNNLINTGNYIEDKITRDWTAILDLVLGGNAFYVCDDKYSQAIHVPVEYVTPVMRDVNTDDDINDLLTIGAIKEIQINEGSVIQFREKKFPWEQVIHIKLPNPFNPFYGLSLFAAASRPLLLDRYKNEFEMAFYLRGGSNSGVIETDRDISRQRLERLQRTFEQAFTGKRNWWRPLFLPAGAKWRASGTTMTAMQHLEGLRENRLTLLAVLGIPPSQLGIVQDVNRATSETQEISFWQNTIVPLAKFIAAGWNNSYVVKTVYKGSVYIAPDLEGISALEGSLYSKALLAKDSQDFLVIHELREIMGYPPLKDTDPRNNMFVAEVRANAMAMSIQNNDDLGVAEEDAEAQEGSKSLTQGNTNDGTGDYRHIHYAEWDGQGNGSTIGDVQGEGEKHQHTIRRFVVEPAGSDSHIHPKLDGIADPYKAIKAKIKTSMSAAQDKILKSDGARYLDGFAKYIKVLTDQAAFALKAKKDVGSYLLANRERRKKTYMESLLPLLTEVLEKGFTISLDNTKSLSAIRVSKKAAPLGIRFSPTDELAIDIIRTRTRDGQRALLEMRMLEGFIAEDGGIDLNRTKHIMQMIEDGMAEGETLSKIARTIADEYNEAYRDQFFTIARTETLTAISQGIAWNHESVKQVFTHVQKQWVHVGDVGSNEDARVEHASFESVGNNGIVDSDYTYYNPTTGGRLKYPRDPSGSAGDVINCRCSLSTIVPNDAVSRADIIVG